MTTDFLSLTEVSGDEVTAEQVERLARRYYWASDYCTGKDVLEVACGSAQGAGYLATVSRTVMAGDYSFSLLSIARRHYGRRLPLAQFEGGRLPFRHASFDVVIILEAIYYLPSVERFLTECRRVLRRGGTLLVASANKDLFDFNPSPRSTRYLGVVELGEVLQQHGFSAEFFGDTPMGTVSIRQRVLRPAKAVAARLGLIPKSMHGKKRLKRLVFGRLVPMPAELTAATAPRREPSRLPAGVPDRVHKVILCAATLDGRG